MTETDHTPSSEGYRLLACDIDNTLARFPDPVSPRVIRAIQAAIDVGVTVTLVTGRAYRRALPVAQQIGLTTPIVCNHGGSIRGGVDGALLQRRTMPRAITQAIVAWFRAHGLCNLVFDGDHVLRDCGADQLVPDFHIYTNGAGSTYIEDLVPAVPEETEIVMGTSTDRGQVAEVAGRAMARWAPAVRVLYTHPYSVDVLPHVTKSEGLAWLAEQMGVARDAVMAIGDGLNDIDMLAWARLGVAMGDGHPDAQAAADVVAPSFDDDGVAWAIERYILDGKTRS